MNAQNMHVVSNAVNPIDAELPVDCVEIQNKNADRYTILRAYEPAGKILEFTDGEWRKQKGVRKTFLHDADTFEARDLNAVFRRLRRSTAHAVFVHGLPKPGVEKQARRLNVNFAEKPHNIFMLDFDKLGILTNERGEVVTEPAECARIVRARMSQEFHDAAVIWNATSGHGLEGGKARLRLIAWASRAINLAEAKAWAIRQGLDADLSIYRKTQPVFLAPPTIATEGMKDPVAERWGMLDGQGAVEVPVDLRATVAKEHERLTTVAPGCIVDAPHMIEKFVLSNLKPRNADRIGESGRHMSIFNAANDAFDLGLSRDTASALLNLWFDHENDDTLFNAIEHLGDIMSKQAEGIAQDVRACGAAIGDAWHGDAMDESDVERMIDDAITSRTSPHGCKFEKALGDAFGAVEVEHENAMRCLGEIEAIRCAFNRVEMADDEALDAMRDALVKDGMDPEAADIYRLAVRGIPEADMITGEADDLLNRILAKAEKAREKAKKPEAPKQKLTFSLKDLRQAGPYIPTWIVKGFLPLNVSAILWGLPGSLKSTAISSIGFSMATQTPWIDGTTLRRGGFLYCAMESAEHTKNMFHGFFEEHADKLDAETNYPLEIHAEVLGLYDRAGKPTDGEKKIISLALSHKSRFDVACELIVLDTLSRIIVGGNENLPADIAIISAAVERIRQATGATVIVLHHATKDGTSMRGAGALTGNFEGVLKAERTGDKGSVKVDRLKGVRAGAKLRYTSEEIQIGQYADESPMHTFVLRQQDSTALLVADDDEATGNATAVEADTPAEVEKDALSDRERRLLEIAKGFDHPFKKGELLETYNAKFRRLDALTMDKLDRAMTALRGGHLGLIAEGKRADWRWHVLPEPAGDAEAISGDAFEAVDDE